MNKYECEIKRGKITVFNSTTMADNPKKAENNTWAKYAYSEGVPRARIGIFLAQKKNDDPQHYCICKEITAPVQVPEKPVEPKRVQLGLFDDKLNSALELIAEYK